MRQVTALVVGLLMACLLTGCGVQKWEYTYYAVPAPSMPGSNLDARVFFPDSANPDNEPIKGLNGLGNEGWEVVGVVSTLETVHPNFGNSDYVTGLQPNTRTREVVLLLKRPQQPKKESGKIP